MEKKEHSFKKQLLKIKDNWLLVSFILILLAFIGVSSMNFSETEFGRNFDYSIATDYDYEESAGLLKTNPIPSGRDFSPEIEERKITKTVNMQTEVERGEFKQVEAQLKNIIKSSDSYLLSENIRQNEEGWKSYYEGYYQIKVETENYDSVILDFKEIGEVKSFNENSADITESYTDTEIELAAEKERLERYLGMYEEAEEVEDKITLNDRIFNQERRIKYLEESLENMDKRVDYSTVSLNIYEKQSEYSNIVFVKLSGLAREFVNSLNSLLKLIILLIPYAVAIWIILFARRIFKKIKKS